jgi:hypothetical protein
MANLHSQALQDANLVLQDAGLIAASANGDYILDIGAGFVDAEAIIDVTALEVASADETYDIYVEGSNVAAMTSGSVNLGSLHMGVAAAPADDSSATGRFVLPFRNEQNGTVYRYIRLYFKVAGTVATGINLSAFVAKK